MIHALVLAAAAQAAPPAATWTMDGPPGDVRSITGRVRTGGRIVADRFVGDVDSVNDEKQGLAHPDGPAGSCARAAAVRPFTRLRRFAADGRLLWEWRVLRDTEQALRLLAPPPGDCLSPDGARLLVRSYSARAGEPASLLGGAVIAVDRRPRFVDAKGRRTGREFGPERTTAPSGWRRGANATLNFVVVDGEHETPDEAVLGRRP